MKTNGSVALGGNLQLKVIRPPVTSVPPSVLSPTEILKFGTPRLGLSDDVNKWRFKNIPNLWRGARRIMAARASKVPHFYGQLSLMVGRCKCGDPHSHTFNTPASPRTRGGVCPLAEFTDLGLASLRVVTNAGVDFIVDAFQNIVELELMRFHGIGTGSVAENVTDTALGTELTTQLNPDNLRADGSQVEGASSNIYRTVGTNTVDSAVAITEHGIFSVVTVAAGVLLDRTVFAVVNLADGDSLQTTYDLTITAGS